MSDGNARHGSLSRRGYLRGGSALAAGALLAGCTSGTGRENGGDGADGDTDGSTETGTGTDEGATTPGSDGPYEVTMEPMGTVEFESPPETWMAYFSTYGDMGIALGQLEGLEGLIFTENWPLDLYDALPGVDVSFDSVRQLESEGSIDRELFYDLDCDVHLFDPNFIRRLDDSWEPSDFDDVAAEVGPIVGNSIRRRDEEWHDYPYYSLYEAFEKIAEVFRERERYEAIRSLHDEFLADLRSRLPPEDRRPEIGLLSINSDFEDGSFYAYPIDDGNGKKQYRDLGIGDAFGDVIDGGYAQWDYEQLLEVDPDILVFSYGFSHASRAEFDERMELMRDDPVGGDLSAVANDRLYRGGTTYQGPIVNLLQTEAAAKQFYPEEFGEWDGLETLAQEDEWLFEHDRLADVVNGEFR